MTGTMRAHVGDWLTVHALNISQPERRGEIVAVGEGGVFPFTVLSTSNDHEAIVFPGPGPQVLTSAELAELVHTRLNGSRLLDSRRPD